MIFNGSYSDGDSECVPVFVSVPDDDLVERAESYKTYIRDIHIEIFIIDNDCKPVHLYF